ncbi:unnamed protein product [Mycena citricolor]|uniref:Uncharacterized protein n=1 Tax=Mycena citricolor TaxID=2018698 RepID=A0AAD2I0G0_9AGAR|nr:unnamed protein product [Mycena citricolor]
MYRRPPGPEILRARLQLHRRPGSAVASAVTVAGEAVMTRLVTLTIQQQPLGVDLPRTTRARSSVNLPPTHQKSPNASVQISRSRISL